MAALPFPVSSAPGAIPGEGSGRLLNALCLKDGAENRWFPTPGLDIVASPGVAAPRGGLLVQDTLLLARQDSLYAINAGYALKLVGSLAGSKPITMARDNYAAPVGDAQAIGVGYCHVVAVTENGVFIVTAAGVKPYPPNSSSGALIGSPNSVAFQDGYFFFLYPDGTLRATGTTALPNNNLDYSDQSYTKCESSPGPWLRVTQNADQIWCWGTSTVEVWSDQALSPFPYARAQVIPIGLYGPWAIAGFEPGWDGTQIFVASDGSVRMLNNGYTPTRISTRAVERAIEEAAGPSVLRACVYTFGGNAIWSLSMPNATWEYNAFTQQWHERRSAGLNRWRAETSVQAFNGSWFLGDVSTGAVGVMDAEARTEFGAPVVSRIESGPLRNWPDRARLGGLTVDIATGQGAAAGREASCLIDYSLDGGGMWAAPLKRSIGPVGRYGKRVSVGDLGRCSREGVRVGITVSDPVPFSLRGADLPNVATRMGS